MMPRKQFVSTPDVVRKKVSLFQPDLKGAIFFSLRTTVASLVALAIALWMELGQPQWAAMTVWIVAQNSSGMSFSKGRWRIVGTMGGMISALLLVGILPQYPWLFFLVLALFAGFCTAMASLVRNFRSYAFILMGFTGAIISLSAVEQPDQVFYIAMARGTYITLGVVCEMIAEMIFMPDPAPKIQADLQSRILGLISRSCRALASVARGEERAVKDLCTFLAELQPLNDQLEFFRIEMRRDNHALVNRAYATLLLIAVMLSRGVGLRSRMASIADLSSLKEILARYAQALVEIADICDDRHILAGNQKSGDLLAMCRADLKACVAHPTVQAFEEAIVLTGVETMLRDLHEAILFYSASVNNTALPRNYHLHHNRDWLMALLNGTRTSAGILIAALVWEITAWPSGSNYLTFVAVTCSFFAIANNSVLASRRFLYGAIWAIIGSFIPVFLIIPAISSYFIMALFIGFFMFLGGLALRFPPYAAIAASYANFFPWLLGLDNQTRMDEVQWFNLSLTLFCALWSGVQVFLVILPFNVRQAIGFLQRHLKKGLARLKNDMPRTREEKDLVQYRWVDDTTQRLEQIFRYNDQLAQAEMDEMVKGTLSIMTIGRNILALRALSDEGSLHQNPSSQEMMRAEAALRGACLESERLLHQMLNGAVRQNNFEKNEENGRLKSVFPPVFPPVIASIAGLRNAFQMSNIPAERIELARAAGCLLIIRYELPVGQAFLSFSASN